MQVQHSSNKQEVHAKLCQSKVDALRHFMKSKTDMLLQREEALKFELRNSIIPALQGHILNNLQVPFFERQDLYKTTLNSSAVFSALS
jgi:hypothetical protein